MKRPDRAARARAAARLARGSTLVWRRRAAALARWIRKGRRDDLTGWRAVLGPVARVLALIALAWIAYGILRALPWLCGVLAALWCRAAWKAGRIATREPSVDAPAPLDPEAVRTLLLTVMEDAPTVHLRTVLAHLQEHGQWEGQTVTDLRRSLTALGVPHDRRVKVGRVPTWGVRRADLEAPSPVEPQAPSPTPSTAA
ncbi:hypothetical protein [Streptomyces sp. NPDC088785]|uniref:hypothetical protein n=1 Tax=Streptomyces sp. NPDC088785 TaxID=3365897 RepID=UPI00381D133C